MEVTKEQYEKATALIAQFISNSKKYKYNYRGFITAYLIEKLVLIIGFLLEFVYYILKESGIIDFKLPRNLVRPQTFDLEGRVIFKGNIKDIHPRGRGYQLLFPNNKRRIINVNKNPMASHQFSITNQSLFFDQFQSILILVFISVLSMIEIFIVMVALAWSISSSRGNVYFIGGILALVLFSLRKAHCSLFSCSAKYLRAICQSL